MDAELMHNCLPDRALASTSCMFLRTCSELDNDFHCFCYLLPLPLTTTFDPCCKPFSDVIFD